MRGTAHKTMRAGRFTPLLGIAMLASSASAEDPLLATQEEASDERSSMFFGDVSAGYDHVAGLPNGRDDLARGRIRARLGAIWSFDAAWDIGASARMAAGTDANRDNRRNNDNERSDSVGLDRLFVRWRPGESTSLSLGKTPLPLELSPLVWDQGLRPAGFAIDHSIAVGEFDRVQFTGGYFAGQHLYGDESRIAAVQVAWRWREGAPFRGSVLAGYLDFSDLGELTRQGLARTNSIVSGRLVHDYRLLDLQLVGHAEAGRWPIDARLDLVRNLGADDARNGVRASVSVGDRLLPRGWEFGYAHQRIERDAVMAAFNSDDWWFHSAARGDLAWIGYGIDATWNLRLAGFRELRDGLSEHTHRLRLDLAARW